MVERDLSSGGAGSEGRKLHDLLVYTDVEDQLPILRPWLSVLLLLVGVAVLVMLAPLIAVTTESLRFTVAVGCLGGVLVFLGGRSLWLVLRGPRRD
ncbi:hypothetical protein [Herbiconiux sp. L3-i23]|uniref:hypothetical protein n=1 Tax=Herbiconiux sp. L3-i23 TaxID=2905871 RepID=UPI00205851FD|nr:hypothetical protein [Herbiconiux sp. L3-i23]BDI21432.1 hypothetical protein L3i23_02080 [Herbiconiux sp. L3-i23]